MPISCSAESNSSAPRVARHGPPVRVHDEDLALRRRGDLVGGQRARPQVGLVDTQPDRDLVTVTAVRDTAADPPLDRLRVHPDRFGQLGRGDSALQQRRAQSLVRHPRQDSRVRDPHPGPMPESETSRVRHGDVPGLPETYRGRLRGVRSHGDPVPARWRTVTGMTTHHLSHPEDDHDRPPVDPLRPDRLRCDCGATADRDRRCRKCRARALWDRRATGRRATGRRPHADRPPSRRPESRPRRDRRTGR